MTSPTRSSADAHGVIGVLGLGRMGGPIAERLAAGGARVVAFDPAVSPSVGVAGASSAQDLAARSDMLVTILPTTEVLRDVLAGPCGVIASLRPGTCWVDFTSTDPRVYRDLVALAESRGIACVAAPLAGGPDDARAGTLGFYLAGDPSTVARVTGALALLGPAERRLAVPAGDGAADAGRAHVAKLLANTLWFGQAVAAAEVLLLGRALGLDPEALAGVLRASPGSSAFLEHDFDALLDGDYLGSFGIDRVVDELDAVVSLAAQTGTPHDLTGVVADLHRRALAAYGPADGELLAVKLLEERAHLLLRRADPPVE